MDELDEFNEAPHVINNCSISSAGAVGKNGPIHGMSKGAILLDDDEEIETFDRQRLNSKKAMMMMNEGAIGDDEDDEYEDDYEHISLAMDHENGQSSGDRDADLLNCDDNDNVVLSTDDLLLSDHRPLNPNLARNDSISNYSNHISSSSLRPSDNFLR